MMQVRKLGFGLLAAVVLVVAALAQDHAHHGEDAAAEDELRLSPELRQLLIREMLAIQDGMQALIPAIAAGRWPEIAEIGRRIHGSYILRQEISETQLEELQRSLSPAFIDMDKAFHEAAARLAEAADQEDGEVVGFYFFKLHQGCVSCHAKFASRRFPGFADTGEHEGHH